MRNGLFTYQALGAIARLLRWVLSKWLLLAIAAFFLSPIGPHLRTSYTYRGDDHYRAYISCTYLGARGYTTLYHVDCPVIILLENKRDPD